MSDRDRRLAALTNKIDNDPEFPAIWAAMVAALGEDGALAAIALAVEDER
jgi:hypothetical protein